MGQYRIIGIVLLVLGIGLLIAGLNAKDSVSDQVSEAFTGNYTDETLWFLIGGGVAGAAGIAMLLSGGKRA